MPLINTLQKSKVTDKNLKENIYKKIYDKDEINDFNLSESIDDHILEHRPTLIRSKEAYKQIIAESTKTSKYMLPGNMYMFYYSEPKLKEELKYYDRTPLILSLGIMRTNDNNIREIGLNLHYYPPFARKKILTHTYEIFKPWFNNQFNQPVHKPSNFISYKALNKLLKNNLKIAFGIKMYVPMLRGYTYQIPTRLFSTAFYTEGHFSKATLSQIFSFWRKF